MKFCLFLKRKTLITAEQLVAALEVQQASLPPIGQLAIEEGILSARTVFKVLRCQTDLPHDRFGELAVELSLMSQAQLDQLLAIQTSRQTPLVDILVRQRVLTRDQVAGELAAYRRELEEQSVVTTRRIVGPRHAAVSAAASCDAEAAEYYAMMI